MAKRMCVRAAAERTTQVNFAQEICNFIQKRRRKSSKGTGRDETRRTAELPSH